jgi:hypothetical protein
VAHSGRFRYDGLLAQPRSRCDFRLPSTSA